MPRVPRWSFPHITVLALLAVCHGAFAQSNTGVQPFGSFTGGGLDTINVRNGNLHISIPILSKSGRGLPFSYSLSYDSTIWQPAGPDFRDNGPTQWVPAPNYGWNPGSSALKNALSEVQPELTDGISG